MKFLLATILVLGLSLPATAEPPTVELEGVDVTARKWVEPALEVPQSVTVIPEKLVRDAGIRKVSQAAIYVPNLSLVEFTARRLSFPFVRGVGSGQGDPAVTTYLDGVPLLFGSTTNPPLLNVERIEFLRGPQGTLYGRNALGGLIHIVTKPPPHRLSFGAEVTVGSYSLRQANLMFGAPLVDDRLSLALAGLVLRRDGYTKNDYTGNRVDYRDTLYGQGQLLFTPDDRNEFRLNVFAERTRDGGFALSELEGLRDRPWHIDQDFEGVTERDVFLPSLVWRHEGDAVDLVSITSFTDYDVLETSDFDFTAQDLVRRQTEEEGDAFTQEFRVSSAPDDADLRWLVGFLAFATDHERSAANDFRQFGFVDESAGEFRDLGLGVFGEVSLEVLEGLTAGVGLRYDYEKKKAELRRGAASEDFSKSFDEILPRFDLAWRATEEVRLYGYAARGFKAGGFNLAAPPGLIPYGPETSWTFEVGARTLFFDGRLLFDAALFWIDWDDMQLSQFDAEAGGYVTNAGESTSRGLGLQAVARPVEGLDLFATFGLTDTEFDSYVDQFGEDVSGNRLPFAPRTTLSFGAQWTGRLGTDMHFHLRGEYARLGTFYYDAGNRESESFGIANFRAGLGGERWRLEAWVRNAFDEAYVPVAFQPNPADPSTFVGECGPPQTAGITFRLDL